MNKVRLWILIRWLALKWVFRINLGDYVWYNGSISVVYNGNRCGMWRIGLRDLPNDGWVKRSDCKKLWHWRNMRGSWKSAIIFYKTSWEDTWRRTGTKKWLGLNIW